MIAAVTTFVSLYTKYCGRLNLSVPFFHLTSIAIIILTSTKNSRHLERKYARIFISRHNPLKDANSFPRAKLCKKKGRGLGRSDSVRGQIHDIFTLNGSFCVYHPSNIFQRARFIITLICQYVVLEILPLFCLSIVSA